MDGGMRRIRFLLSPRNPIDAEILNWIDSLPRSARGTEMKAHLTAALIEYIRKTDEATQRTPKLGNVTDATLSPKRDTAPREPRFPAERGTVRNAQDHSAAPPSGALARHLLKDFG
jgi:hypothetical protein